MAEAGVPGMRRWVTGLLMIGALAALCGGMALLHLRGSLEPVTPPGIPDVSFTVPRGAGLKQVARDLESTGLIRSARTFEWLARWRGLGTELRAGEYGISPSLSSEEILLRIADGAVQTYAVSIPEGLRIEEIAERVGESGLADRDAFLAIVRSPEAPARFGVEGPGMEGYLFPETYRLARGLPTETLVEAMLEQFHEVWNEIEPEARAAGLSMREVVTLASIVEKETGAAPERPHIASVFLNRIERGMRLETDPTVIYGIQDFDGNLTRAHLDDASNPYNTYQIPSLPPGPICNPGAAALRAIVRPDDSDDLYFVSRNDGTHVFSRTYREHVNAVNRFQRRRSTP